MAAISAARHGWPTPQELSAQIERWLAYAVGHWHAADNVIGLLRTTRPPTRPASACRGSMKSSPARAGRSAWAHG
jgi:hypothetical protein